MSAAPQTHAGDAWSMPLSQIDVSKAELYERGEHWDYFARLRKDDPVHFCVELIQDETTIERVPNEGAIEAAVPSPDYELIMWQA